MIPIEDLTDVTLAIEEVIKQHRVRHRGPGACHQRTAHLARPLAKVSCRLNPTRPHHRHYFVYLCQLHVGSAQASQSQIYR